MLSSIRHLFLVAVVAAMLVVGLSVVAPAVAGPTTCVPPAVITTDHHGGYTCTIPGDPGGGGGGGGGSTPTCDLSGAGGTDYSDHNRSANFCIGQDVCFDTDVFVPYRNPYGDPPNKDSTGRITWCYDGIMGPPSTRRFFWDGQEPTPLEQAQTAIGKIQLGAGQVSVSPSVRTLVNLDTWFWVTGRQRVATGSSAFGLVAVATFRSMSVDPGDGAGSFACPWTATQEQAQRDCFHEYRRSSRAGTEQVDGHNAFGVRVTAIYDLRFEVNGAVTQIPGAPKTLDAPPADVAVRVDEVQSQVTGVS